MNLSENINHRTIEIKEGELDSIPTFYESLTDSPVREMLGGRSVHNFYLKFIKTIDFDELISTGSNTVTCEHNAKGMPLVFVYCIGRETTDAVWNIEIPAYLPGAWVLQKVTIGKKYFEFNVQSFVTAERLYFRAFIYEFFERT